MSFETPPFDCLLRQALRTGFDFAQQLLSTNEGGVHAAGRDESVMQLGVEV
jgi:hypothetical protein